MTITANCNNISATVLLLYNSLAQTQSLLSPESQWPVFDTNNKVRAEMREFLNWKIYSTAISLENEIY